METLVTLARVDGPHGETALRLRSGPFGEVHELIVNGRPAMDSRETSSERALARFVPAAGRPRVLVGGLGLGYTAAAVLDGPADRLDVVELEPALVSWARARTTPLLARVAGDPRVRLHVGDIAAVLRGERSELPGPWEAVLLDVDNGPDFLLHEPNAGLYAPRTLRAAWDRLAPGGVLAVWCQGSVPALAAALGAVAPTVAEHPFAVQREGRRFTYVVCTLTRPPVDGPAGTRPDAG